MSADPEVPQFWNRYSYALNSPLAFVDPSGTTVVALGDEEQRLEVLNAFK
jgi:hypothetical protein